MIASPDLKELRKNIEEGWDKIETRIDQFVEEGKKWTEKARNGEILERLSALQTSLQEKMGVDYNKIYEVLNLATREEVDELQKKVRNLERRIRELKAEAKPAKAAKTTKKAS